MAISFITSAGAGWAATTTVTVSKPTGTVNDDVMLAVLVCTTQGRTITSPGWVQVGTAVEVSAGTSTQTFLRVAASEGASYVFTISGAATSGSVLIDTYRGANPVSPVNASAGGGVAAATLGVAPTVTPTVPGCQIVGLFGSNSLSVVGASVNDCTLRSSFAIGANRALTTVDTFRLTPVSCAPVALFNATGDMNVMTVALAPASPPVGLEDVRTLVLISSVGTYTVYTVPWGMVTTIRYIRAVNTTAGALTLSITIGTAKLWDAVSIPAHSAVEAVCTVALAPSQTITVAPSGAGVDLCVSGIESS